jgi:hypothetical protein
MTPVDDEPTRESWLLSAIDRMARSLFPAFKQPKWRVTCGGTYDIFISPELDRPLEMLHTSRTK